MSPIIRTVREQIRPTDIDRLVGILADGGIVVIPADTVYGLVGKAFDPEVFSRLDTIKEERHLPYAVIFPSLEELEEWYGDIGFRRRRLASSLMPGPVTLLLPNNPNVPTGFRYHSAGIGVRVASDFLLSTLAGRVGGSLWGTSANRSGDPAPSDFRSVNRNLIQAVDMAIDNGPTTFRDASTVLDLRSSEFKISRKGPWAKRVEQSLKRSMDPLQLIAVCSGNICRSPIAAEILKYELKQLGITQVVCGSAGLDAVPEMPPTNEMVEIALEWGLDISRYRATQLSIESIRQADILLTASPMHRQRILNIEPRALRKTFLMAESLGLDTIPDPYHSGGDEYQRTADLIREAMRSWAARLKSVVVEEFGLRETDAMPPADLTGM